MREERRGRTRRQARIARRRCIASGRSAVSCAPDPGRLRQSEGRRSLVVAVQRQESSRGPTDLILGACGGQKRSQSLETDEEVLERACRVSEGVRRVPEQRRRRGGGCETVVRSPAIGSSPSARRTRRTMRGPCGRPRTALEVELDLMGQLKTPETPQKRPRTKRGISALKLSTTKSDRLRCQGPARAGDARRGFLLGQRHSSPCANAPQSWQGT